MDPSQAPEVVSTPEKVKLSTPPEIAGVQRDEQGSHGRAGRVCGLRRSTFWLVIILVLVVIVAAVGGGVGGSMAVSKAKSSQNCQSNPSPSATSAPDDHGGSSTDKQSTDTSTAAATATSGFVAPTDVFLPMDCDDGRQRSVTIKGNVWNFQTNCETDRVGGDFFTTVAYSLHDCFMACASFNSYSGSNVCTALAFGTDMAKYLEKSAGNCFLKNSTEQATVKSDTISAVLSD